MWYIHTLEHYSTIKSEIMPFAATWMQVVLVVKSLPVNAGHATGHAMQDMQQDMQCRTCNAGHATDTGSLPGWGRCLGVGSSNPSGILAWKIPWTDEPGGLQSIGLHRVGHD